MPSDNVGSSYPLFEFAFIPKFHEELGKLVNLAEEEDWSYHNQESPYPYPVLFNYIQYTFMRLKEEQKIAKTADGKFACFNTGLVTNFQESIFMVFEKNYLKNNTPWHFKKFAKKGDYELTKFPVLPDIAHYFSDPSLLVFDTRLEFRPQLEHILSENRDRFSEPYKSMAYYGLQNLLKGAIESACERVRRNYKVAIPQYFRGKVQLLLPLCFADPTQADLALVVTRHDEDVDASEARSRKKSFYRASTCLTLDQAYNNARQLARPDRDWLEP